VRVTETGWRGVLVRVPILRLSAGVWDHEAWVPKKPDVNVTGGELNTEEGAAQTPPHDTDADQVLVGFMGDDLGRPVILGQLDNPNTLRGTDANTDLQDYQWYRFVRGIFFGLHKDGRLVVDLSSASTGEVQSDGSQDTSGDGKLEIVTRNGSLTLEDDGVLTVTTAAGSVLEIDGAGGATFEAAAGQKFSMEQGGSAQALMKAPDFQMLLGNALIEIVAVGAAAGVPSMPNTSSLMTQCQAAAYSTQTAESD
jgi:hypothetical protein